MTNANSKMMSLHEFNNLSANVLERIRPLSANAPRAERSERARADYLARACLRLLVECAALRARQRVSSEARVAPHQPLHA